MIALENIFLLNIKYLRFYRWKVLKIKGQNVGVFFTLVVSLGILWYHLEKQDRVSLFAYVC